jgi:lipopolysaccharide/colanic/teichoic acid biosynthesis glycosyltransferase
MRGHYDDVGRFVRRTSLDELPQLWNVLVGEMSLVGPRPVVEEELENYGTTRDLLLSVRPGITRLPSVCSIWSILTHPHTGPLAQPAGFSCVATRRAAATMLSTSKP